MMKKLVKWMTGFCLGVLLSGGISVSDAPEKTVPISESSLFFQTAHAAFWDGWFSQAPTTIAFSELYGSVSSLGIEFSEKLARCDGQRVSMVGFMAPPLKPTIRFFVLTQDPMSICPFCSSDADWPADIIVVYLSDPVMALPFDRPIRVTGQLSLGTSVDEETGFVSLVRIQADTLEEI